MITFAACLWTGLFPLLQCGTYSHITRDKWIFMLILAAVSLCCFFGDLALKRRAVKPSRAFIWAMVIAALLAGRMILSCAFSPLGWSACWNGLSSRNEGLSTQLVYIGLFVLFAFSRVRLRPVLISAAAGVLFFTFVVGMQRTGINALGLYPNGRSIVTNYEFQGTIGNIDMDTGYLCVMAALFLTEIMSALTDRGRLCSAGHLNRNESAVSSVLYLDLLLIALIASVYLIMSMEVQFGVIALGALLLITIVVWLPKALRLPLLILFWTAAFCLVWFWDREGGGIWELHEIFHGRTQLSFGSNRIAVWIYSLALAFQSPFVGGGSDTFVDRFNQFIRDHGLKIPDHQGAPGEPGYIPALPTYYDNPHNEYIAHLVNHGLAAMLLFIALIVVTVMISLRKKPDLTAKGAARRRALPPLAAAVICYAVQAFFSFSVPLVAPIFWVIMGMCVSEGICQSASD